MTFETFEHSLVLPDGEPINLQVFSPPISKHHDTIPLAIIAPSLSIEHGQNGVLANVCSMSNGSLCVQG